MSFGFPPILFEEDVGWVSKGLLPNPLPPSPNGLLSLDTGSLLATPLPVVNDDDDDDDDETDDPKTLSGTLPKNESGTAPTPLAVCAGAMVAPETPLMGFTIFCDPPPIGAAATVEAPNGPELDGSSNGDDPVAIKALPEKTALGFTAATGAGGAATAATLLLGAAPVPPKAFVTGMAIVVPNRTDASADLPCV